MNLEKLAPKLGSTGPARMYGAEENVFLTTRNVRRRHLHLARLLQQDGRLQW